jgi:hypothetical protein
VTSAARLQPAFRRADTGFAWALTSPQALTDQHPGLRLVKEVSVVELINRSYQNHLVRATIQGLLRFPASRNTMRLAQYQLAH